MISKKDTALYFEKLACNEREIINNLQNALTGASDPYVTGFLRNMLANEMMHYGTILELLNKKSFLSPAAENRLLVRRDLLGSVRLTPQGHRSSKILEAHCVNISHGGMCFETRHLLTVGQSFDVLIRPYDQSELIRRGGKVVWVRETLPGFYTAGMQFES